MSDDRRHPSARWASRAARLNWAPPYPLGQWSRRCESLGVWDGDVIHLDIGSPDLPPPDSVIQALQSGEAASADSRLGQGYSSFEQETPLREAIARYYARRFDVSLDPETEIVPLLGSKEGIVLFSLASLDPDNVVLVTDPGYTPYQVGARLAEANVVSIPLRPDLGFLPDLDGVPQETADRARILWLNYPNNPTGAVAERGFFEKVVSFARKHEMLVCHDAPYSDVFYGLTPPRSILETPDASDVAVEFNSLSKTFNMAGFRVGMAVGNRDALHALAQLRSNTGSGMVVPVLSAAVAALSVDESWIAARNCLYAERMEILAPAIQSIGLQVALPEATPYLWTKIPSGCTSEQFAIDLLERTGIAVAPGRFFGGRSDSYVRWSVTSPAGTIQAAAEHLERVGKTDTFERI